MRFSFEKNEKNAHVSHVLFVKRFFSVGYHKTEKIVLWSEIEKFLPSLVHCFVLFFHERRRLRKSILTYVGLGMLKKGCHGDKLISIFNNKQNIIPLSLGSCFLAPPAGALPMANGYGIWIEFLQMICPNDKKNCLSTQHAASNTILTQWPGEREFV